MFAASGADRASRQMDDLNRSCCCLSYLGVVTGLVIAIIIAAIVAAAIVLRPLTLVIVSTVTADRVTKVIPEVLFVIPLLKPTTEMLYILHYRKPGFLCTVLIPLSQV